MRSDEASAEDTVEGHTESTPICQKLQTDYFLKGEKLRPLLILTSCNYLKAFFLEQGFVHVQASVSQLAPVSSGTCKPFVQEKDPPSSR